MKQSVKVEMDHVEAYVRLNPELKGTTKTHVVDIMLRKVLSVESTKTVLPISSEKANSKD